MTGWCANKDGTLEVEPALAESWTISDDGTVYTFKLREGVSFHDGTPLNAEAVKFTFRPDCSTKSIPFTTPGRSPLAFFFLPPFDTVTAVDDLTVEFKLKEPYAPFLSNLAYPTGLIVFAHGRRGQRRRLRPHSVGHPVLTNSLNGRPTPKVVVTRNEDYWDAGRAGTS